MNHPWLQILNQMEALTPPFTLEQINLPANLDSEEFKDILERFEKVRLFESILVENREDFGRQKMMTVEGYVTLRLLKRLYHREGMKLREWAYLIDEIPWKMELIVVFLGCDPLGPMGPDLLL